MKREVNVNIICKPTPGTKLTTMSGLKKEGGLYTL